MQHNIRNYKNQTVKTYITADPCRYEVPSRSKDLKFFSDELKTKVTSVCIHIYPTEHIVALEGTGLLFCSKIHLGREEVIKLDISSQEEKLTSKMIQFNYSPSAKTERLIAQEKIRVATYSYFHSPIIADVPVSKVRN